MPVYDVVFRGSSAAARAAVNELAGSFGHLNREAGHTGGGLNKLEKDIGRAERGALAGSGAFTHLGRSIAFASAAFLGTAELTHFFKESITGAANLQREMYRTNVAFTTSAKSVREWSENVVDSMGMSSGEALKVANNFGQMLRPLGIAPAKAAQMSEAFAKLATDLAALRGEDPDRVLNAMTVAFSGRARALRRYGIFIDDTRVKAEALRLGLLKANVDMSKVNQANEQVSVSQAKYNKALKDYGPNATQTISAHRALESAQGSLSKAMSGTSGALTQQQRVMATYSLVTHDAAYANGTFEKRSGSLAVMMRKLHAEIGDMQEALGTALLPVVKEVVTGITEWAGRINHNREAHENFIRTMHQVGSAARTLAHIIRDIGEATAWVADKLGGWKQAFELILGGLLARKVLELSRTIRVSMATAFIDVGTQAKITSVDARVAFTAMQEQAVLSSRAMRIAFIQTGLGLIIIALSEFVVLVITHWSQVKKVFQEFTVWARRTLLDFSDWLKEQGLRWALGIIDPFSHLPGKLGGWARRAKESLQTELFNVELAHQARHAADSFGKPYLAAMRTYARQAAGIVAQGAGAAAADSPARAGARTGAAGGSVASGRAPTTFAQRVSGPTAGLSALQAALPGAKGDPAIGYSGHAKKSYHYSGEALDIGDGGNPNSLISDWEYLYPLRGNFVELIWDPPAATKKRCRYPTGGYFDGGIPGRFTDHHDHIHVAFTGTPADVAKIEAARHTAASKAARATGGGTTPKPTPKAHVGTKGAASDLIPQKLQDEVDIAKNRTPKNYADDIAALTRVEDFLLNAIKHTKNRHKLAELYTALGETRSEIADIRSGAKTKKGTGPAALEFGTMRTGRRTVELTNAQKEVAAEIYRIALEQGLTPAQALQLVAAAYAESTLNPNARNKQSGAFGVFQLLSKGYRDAYNYYRSQGLDPVAANTMAILIPDPKGLNKGLPTYKQYFLAHPNARAGAAAAAVENSGEGAGFYSRGIGSLFKLGTSASTIRRGTTAKPTDTPQSRIREVATISGQMITASQQLNDLFKKGVIDEQAYDFTVGQMNDLRAAIKAAFKDGIITKKERDDIKAAFGEVNSTIEEAIKQQKLDTIQFKIIGRTFKQIVKDGIITDDELDVLDEKLNQLNTSVKTHLLGLTKTIRDQRTKLEEAWNSVVGLINQAFEQRVIGRVANLISFGDTQLDRATNVKKADRARGTIASIEASGTSPVMAEIKGRGDTLIAAWDTFLTSMRGASTGVTSGQNVGSGTPGGGTSDEQDAVARAAAALAEAQDQWDGLAGEWTDTETAYHEAYQRLIDAKAAIGRSALEDYQKTYEATARLKMAQIQKPLNQIFAALRSGKVKLADVLPDLTALLASVGLTVADIGDLLDNSQMQDSLDALATADDAMVTALADLQSSIDALNATLQGTGGVSAPPAGTPTSSKPGGPGGGGVQPAPDMGVDASGRPYTASTNYRLARGYATGGIVRDLLYAARGAAVPYVPRGTDTVPAMLTPGEVVLNAAQERRLADRVQGGGGVTIVVPISGDVYTMDGREFADKVAPAIRDALIRHSDRKGRTSLWRDRA